LRRRTIPFSNQSGLRAPSLVRNIVFYRYLAPVCRQAGLRGNPFKLLAYTNTPISLFISFSFFPILPFPSSHHLTLPIFSSKKLLPKNIGNMVLRAGFGDFVNIYAGPGW
jgi:hypothetical protein